MTLNSQLTFLLVAGVAAAASLVAIWAARSPRHWFWRAFALWTFVAAMAPIRAYEPALVLAIGLPLIVCLVKGGRLIRDGGWRNGATLRFRLHDLFLVMAIVGISLALLIHIGQRSYRASVYAIVVPAIVLAAMATASFWLATGPRRVLALACVAILVPLSAWSLWPHVEWLDEVDMTEMAMYRVSPSWDGYLRGFSSTCGGLLVFAVLVVASALVILAKPANGRLQRLVRTIGVAIGVATTSTALWLYVAMLPLTPYPSPLETAENHAPRILQIAERVLLLNPAQPGSGEPQAASLYATEVSVELSQIYDELLQRLDAPNSMPFDPAVDSTRSFFTDTTMNRIQSLRHLSRCFQAEIREAELAGDHDRALELAIGKLRIGVMLCRNSIDVEMLVGHAIMGTANRNFVEYRKRLDSAASARMEAALNRAEAEHESLERTHQRDVAFTERAFGWQVRWVEILDRAQYAESSRKATVQMYDRWRAFNRLLVTDLAIRRFHREHNAWPKALSNLVPEYLDAILLDPFTAQPLLYGVKGDEFVLYSVGNDHHDDGGRFTNMVEARKEGYDFDLDTLTRP
jgi:hypothetical protein